MAYDIDFIDARDKVKGHKRAILLFPEDWNNQDHHINIPLNWNFQNFAENNSKNIPDQKGVYCFIVKPKVPNFFDTSYLFYVGQTTRTLRQRFKEYLTEQKGNNKKTRPKLFDMLNRYKGHLFFYFSEIDSNEDIHDVEEKLLNTFVPHVNSMIPKADANPEYKNIYES